MTENTRNSSGESASASDSQSDSNPRVVAIWIPVMGFTAAAAILVTLLAAGTSSSDHASTAPAPKPVSIDAAGRSENSEIDSEDHDRSGHSHTAVPVSMAEMIELAEQALAHTIANLDDYTARMIKHEQDRSGVLQPQTESFIKVATRHRGGKPGQPLKVYMRFDDPEDVRGREVIWVENENDGKLLVREAGAIGAMMTVPLPPDSFLAMRGQRYPITEIGLTKLLEKLIQRGNRDRDNPEVHVEKIEGYPFDGRELTFLRIRRDRPSEAEGDFSLAELVLDQPNQLVVSFRSFGWPNEKGGDPPLIESYQYLDLKTNVGLTEEDFKTSNPQYTFAK